MESPPAGTFRFTSGFVSTVSLREESVSQWRTLSPNSLEWAGELVVKQEVTRVMVVDDNKEFCRLLQACLEREPGLEFVGAVHDGQTAIKVLPQRQPDLVILDLIMPNLDGLGVLERMKKLGLRSKFIVLSAFGQEEFLHSALELGADYFIMKPFDMQVLLQRIHQLVDENNRRPGWQVRPVAIEERIARQITQLGVPAHYKGYRYLKDAIAMVVENIDLLGQVTKCLYPTIAARHKTSPDKVERAMRHAIETAWSRGNIDVLNETFGYSVDINRGRPTNSSFIAKIADKIRLELKSGRM